MAKIAIKQAWRRSGEGIGVKKKKKEKSEIKRINGEGKYKIMAKAASMKRGV